MKILMFLPGCIEHLPPVLTAAICSSRLGAKVRVIASSAMQETKELLEANGVEVSAERESHPTTKWGRIQLRAQIGKRLIETLGAFLPDCVWYHGEVAMGYALLPGINGKAVRIAQMYEMYDQKTSSRFLAHFGPRRSDIVICPEINRQWILKIRTKSDAVFHCIPNRPLDAIIPHDENGRWTERLFHQSGGSTECVRFLIYQGAMMPGRALPQLIQAFRATSFGDVGLIMMGGEEGNSFRDYLRNLAEGDSRIVFLPHLPPPKHLQVTKGCSAGVVLYEPSSLNNLYCAPNKIYEYSAFGLGMLLPDFPGLAHLNDKYHLGQLCDPLSPSSIREGIERLLLMDPAVCKRMAEVFLDSESDPLDLYARVLADIRRRVNIMRPEQALR